MNAGDRPDLDGLEIAIVRAVERLTAMRLLYDRAITGGSDPDFIYEVLDDRDAASYRVTVAVGELREVQRRLRLTCPACLVHAEHRPDAAPGCDRHAALLSLA